jgi:predicted ArsR family transcriptional regulator
MSLWHKNQRFLASTRGQIIMLLRRSSRTVDELAQALSLTDNAVRAHLAALERDGIVQQRGVRRGSGKPASVYTLAPEAEQLFPKAYDPVLQQLLDVLHGRMTPEEVETLLREVGRRMAGRWKVPPGELRVRLGAAVEDFNELGGMAELEECDGHFCIHSYSCPLADVVLEHPEVCYLAETLLSELVGAPVQKHCDYTGSPRCSFTVPNT